MNIIEWDELLNGRKLLLKSCVRSAIVYESKTWCLRVSKMTILRTKKAMTRECVELN